MAPVTPGSTGGDASLTSPEGHQYRAKALYNCERSSCPHRQLGTKLSGMADTASPDDPNEISFAKGDILEILDKNGKWWQARKVDGSVGSECPPHAPCPRRLLTSLNPLTPPSPSRAVELPADRLKAAAHALLSARICHEKSRTLLHFLCTYMHPRRVRSCLPLPLLRCPSCAVVVSYIYPFCSFGSPFCSDRLPLCALVSILSGLNT